VCPNSPRFTSAQTETFKVERTEPGLVVNLGPKTANLTDFGKLIMPVKTIWSEDGNVYLLDQTLLPARMETLPISTVEQMWDAIKKLRVRGAPAIGVAAAYGVYVAVKNAAVMEKGADVTHVALRACDYLATSRPTAVNLFWALDRVRQFISQTQGDLEQALLQLAESIREEDDVACRAIGRHGAALLKSGDTVLTHCNAGGLATASYGTALAPIYYAVGEEKKQIAVFADETRPLLQGSRLTAWELKEAGIPVTLICDSMAASVMRSGKISAVIVGADRIAANGDFANKIGTYMVALAAREHRVPFYVAAPMSTIDFNLANGGLIPIEERSADEITGIQGVNVAPEGIQVFNPAFDVTPHEFVTGFITEKGIVKAPFEEGLRRVGKDKGQKT